MPEFSNISKEHLAEAHQDIQVLFNEVVKHFNCTVICGHREKEAQDEAYVKGYSQLKYPRSKHNSMPSFAVDVVPYPLDWADTERFRQFGWFVKGVASTLKRYGAIENNIKWGGDWKNFTDLPHWEL